MTSIFAVRLEQRKTVDTKAEFSDSKIWILGLQDTKCPFIDSLNMYFYPTSGLGKHRFAVLDL